MSEKDLYAEIKRRKLMGAKKEIVQAVQKHGKILAIRGKYEKPEKVVKHIYANVKEVIRPSEVTKYNLSLYDLVLVGCPGSEIPKAGLRLIHDYVIDDGGWILCTDWCLRTVVENIFPGYMHWGGEKTDDTIVECQIVDPYHPFLDGVLPALTTGKYAKGPKGYKQPTFSWWLEDKSFPITIDRPDLVKVLIRSEELGRKWGHDPVLCYFDVGKNGGRVIQMISHTHLQKGGGKGKFVSAMIITNIIDEKVAAKHGLKKKGTHTPQYTDYTGDSLYTSPIDWGTPQPTTASADTFYTAPTEYYNPEVDGGADSGLTPELTDTAKIIEVTDRSSIPPGQKCALGDGNFEGYAGRIFKCGGCGTLYHEECLNIQLQEGVCKICGRIFLF